MSNNDGDMHKKEIKLFESKQLRTVWNESEEKWYFSIVDVIAVLTDSQTQITIGRF